MPHNKHAIFSICYSCFNPPSPYFPYQVSIFWQVLSSVHRLNLDILHVSCHEVDHHHVFSSTFRPQRRTERWDGMPPSPPHIVRYVISLCGADAVLSHSLVYSKQKANFCCSNAGCPTGEPTNRRSGLTAHRHSNQAKRRTSWFSKHCPHFYFYWKHKIVRI